MSLNMKSTLEVEANGFARFVALMGEMVPILEREGWKLEGAFMHTSGRLNTVVDLWRLEDYNHYGRGLAVLMAHPEFPRFAQTLGEVVRNESVVFLQPLSYPQP
jgi:hypothetical protein